MFELFKRKKAFIPGINTVFTGILFLAIALFGIVFIVGMMDDERDSLTSGDDDDAIGVINASIAGLQELPERSDTLITVGVIGLILAALVGVGLLAKRMS